MEEHLEYYKNLHNETAVAIRRWNSGSLYFKSDIIRAKNTALPECVGRGKVEGNRRLLYCSFRNTVTAEVGRISNPRIGFPTRNGHDCLQQNHLEAFKRFGTVNRVSGPPHLSNWNGFPALQRTITGSTFSEKCRKLQPELFLLENSERFLPRMGGLIGWSALLITFSK
jgi:hypothetical protein